ncbi:hypothetical protein [uncultured Bilophila sp.]|uniref:hypothetical protein n=1 Tax=uncultured Bilophila sp. TaxID=529385 RepID=UPI0026126C3B|nr:hypothetical protein [uncultured Bilophila sp.]
MAVLLGGVLSPSPKEGRSGFDNLRKSSSPPALHAVPKRKIEAILSFFDSHGKAFFVFFHNMASLMGKYEFTKM